MTWFFRCYNSKKLNKLWLNAHIHYNSLEQWNSTDWTHVNWLPANICAQNMLQNVVFLLLLFLKCFELITFFSPTGMTAGAIGSFIGTPAEISLIRMTSDGRLAHLIKNMFSDIFYQHSLNFVERFLLPPKCVRCRIGNHWYKLSITIFSLQLDTRKLIIISSTKF